MKKVVIIVGTCLGIVCLTAIFVPDTRGVIRTRFRLNDWVDVTFRGKLAAPIESNVCMVNVELKRMALSAEGKSYVYTQMYPLIAETQNVVFIEGGHNGGSVQVTISGGVAKVNNNGTYDVQFGDVLVDHIPADQIRWWEVKE